MSNEKTKSKNKYIRKASVLFELMRPKQWIKNVVVFIPLFFSAQLFTGDLFFKNFYVFIAMCLLSSSVYILNDIIDYPRDRSHPIKKNRPIPSGRIDIFSAFILMTMLLIVSLVYGFWCLQSEYFIILQLAYYLMMLVYSLWLKNVEIIDTIIISLGFILRVFAGAIVLQLQTSALLGITIILGALLISFGKRRAEMSIMQRQELINYRPGIGVYSTVVLNSIISGLFAATFMAYVLFCYSFVGATVNANLTQFLPPLLRNVKWLLITVPFAFYTLVRYLILVYKGGDVADRPEDLWFEDKRVLFSALIWLVVLFLLIYSDNLIGVLKF